MAAASLGWVRVGARVEIRDERGFFHLAHVTKARMEAARREIFVHYPRGQA